MISIYIYIYINRSLYLDGQIWILYLSIGVLPENIIMRYSSTINIFIIYNK